MSQRPRLTLTFDNGPVVGATERILDVLAERGLKATFFLVGDRLRESKARQLAERAHAQGHWIGNHTMSHSGPLGLMAESGGAKREIEEAQAMLAGLVHSDRLFRPVGGGKLGPHLLNREAFDHLVDNRYTVVTWNNVPRDLVDPRRTWVKRALADMVGESWTLLVVHDHCLDEMMDTLTDFLDRAADIGVEFV
jgi:peptidoglycan/xylan/chitin deacetylase (PgdA/CDA1 family)